MKPNFVGRSIGLMQALAVLMASIVIGTALTAIHLGYRLSEGRENTRAIANELLTLAEGGASNAAWTLDDQLAADIVANALTIPGVQSAEIADEDGRRLARMQQPILDRGRFRRWITDKLSEDVVRYKRTLTVSDQGERRTVGSLSIELNRAHGADRFLAEAASTVAATLLQALLIGLVLLWLSSQLVTKPLRLAADWIARINPNEPGDMFIPVPHRHRDNELGHLLNHTNEMLKQLSSSQQELRQLATRDALTGLPNRFFIQEVLESALVRAKRVGRMVAVLFIDLDDFKDINDAHGHETGDRLLIGVAEALRETVRGKDAVGRLGGDEFLVVIEDLASVDEAVRAAARISSVLSQTFMLGTREVRWRASVGVSLFPDDGDNASTLMRQADLAMYKVKEGGGANWAAYSSDLSERLESRLAVEIALDNAFKGGELFIAYQPKFSSTTHTLVGCEALLRWRRGPDDVLSASEFLNIAEGTARIIEIGDWVLDQACERIRYWSGHFGEVRVAVNVSARQINEPDFVDKALSTLSRHGVCASSLEIEITETALMADLDSSARTLSALRRAGIAISIDDFGTGYSSLNYLARLPINSLKIDRSFVSGEHPSRVMLHTIVAMAGALGLETIAEGVETQQQLALITAEGCDIVQGYLTGHPVPYEEFDDLYLRDRQITKRRVELTERNAS